MIDATIIGITTLSPYIGKFNVRIISNALPVALNILVQCHLSCRPDQRTPRQSHSTGAPVA